MLAIFLLDFQFRNALKVFRGLSFDLICVHRFGGRSSFTIIFCKNGHLRINGLRGVKGILSIHHSKFPLLRILVLQLHTITGSRQLQNILFLLFEMLGNLLIQSVNHLFPLVGISYYRRTRNIILTCIFSPCFRVLIRWIII